MTESAHRELAGRMVESGAISEDWADAFTKVPRSSFLPDLMWPLADQDNGEYGVVDRATSPVQWRRWADSDVPIVTQWDEGKHAGPEPGGEPTSSSSMPSMVASMLTELNVGDDVRVLEVGTGTGWCAGLLSARVGEDNVVSVEVDRQVADIARIALEGVGYRPKVIVADGTAGWAEEAPYDRLLATACARTIPAAWIEQVRPGGVIVTPWGTRYSQHDGVARLVVAPDGTASGHFTRGVGFMKLRSQRGVWPRHADYLPDGEWPSDVRESATALCRDDLGGVAEFVIGLLVPHVVHTTSTVDDDTTALLLYGLTDRSWAVVFFCSDGCTEFLVYQHGPHDLWTEVETAYRWWDGNGRPGYDRFGLTTGPVGETPWLDRPDRPLDTLGNIGATG